MTDCFAVLKWIFERTEGSVGAVDTAIGKIPDIEAGDLDTEGLDVSEEIMAELFNMDNDLWKADTLNNEKNLGAYGLDLPEGIRQEHFALKSRLGMK